MTRFADIPRPRVSRKRDEARLQEDVLKYLRLVAPQCVVFHVPNGGSRDKIEGKNLKNAGVLAGVPDLAIIAPGGLYHGIELKTPKGETSDAQLALHARFAALGIPFAVCRSTGDVATALAAWKIQTREVA